MQDCFVSLVTPRGILVAEGWANESGLAEFEELPPGPYFIYSNSEAAYSIAGREALTSIQLLPGESRELTISIGSTEGFLEVSIDCNGLPMPQGFFIGSSHRVNCHLPSNGVATLPASATPGYIGVSANRTGYTFIATQSIPSDQADTPSNVVVCSNSISLLLTKAVNLKAV